MDKNYHSDSPQDGRRATADGSPRPTPKPAQPGNGFKSAEGTALLSSPQPPRPRQPANPYELEYAETAPLSALETWLKPDPGEEPTKRLEDGEEAAQFSRVGKYEYLGEIARGGMGRIVLVRDRLLRRRVAMKLLISPDGKPSKHTIDRFLAEAQVTGQLEHPNIVPIHDVGTYQDNSHYFTMKLVKGTTLSAAFRKLAEGDEQYSLPRLLAVFQQIANGLSFAHARGVIHRDLKPDNIMLGEFGEVLIMDWGLAKLKHAPPPSANGAGTPGGRKTTALFGTLDTQDVEGTVAGTVAGTPGYMSPEQARGEIDRLDGRADIFALGAMLYEALAGSPPYNQRGVTARVRAAAKEEPIEPPAARLRKTNPQRAARIPREVAAIAMKALSPKPEDRYSTAREFGEDIQRYLEGRSVLACPDTPAQRAVKWVRRNRVMVGAVAAVVCAVIVAAVGARLLIHYSNISRFTREARQIVAAAAAERGRQMQLIPAVDKANDPYAGFIEQRAMDSIDEKYTQQLAQAAEYYTRVFDYDPANQTARAELAKLYMEMWRAAARRNQ
ncbi:MAG TPA: protein kinase, partial [Blastocatellia bacterium]|nr:protein kinase [Blastocatellia bacterium]